jgi:hypothetical protein
MEDSRRGALDVGVMSKEVATFADVHGAQLPGLLVHVAEKVTVDCLKVREIETAF